MKRESYYKKSTTELKKIAERLLHKFVVLDEKKTCFTCGRVWREGLRPFHAGHLWHGKGDLIRDNLHCQCYNCNCNTERGNHLVYENRFIERFEQERFDRLLLEVHQVNRYTQDELIDMIFLYQTKIKEFVNE